MRRSPSCVQENSSHRHPFLKYAAVGMKDNVRGEGTSDIFSLHASTSSEFVLVLFGKGCIALLWSGRDQNKARWRTKD